MNNEKAELEIKNLEDVGLSFNYEFDYNNINKFMFVIEESDFSIKDIINKCNSTEKIIFMLNDGYKWNGKMGKDYKTLYSEKDDGSIYWTNFNNQKYIRIDSNEGSIRKWIDKLGVN